MSAADKLRAFAKAGEVSSSPLYPPVAALPVAVIEEMADLLEEASWSMPFGGAKSEPGRIWLDRYAKLADTLSDVTFKKDGGA